MNGLLLLASFIVMIMAFNKGGDGSDVFSASPLAPFCNLATTLAILLGGIYCAFGFTKNFAMFYKLFFAFFTVSEGLIIVYYMTLPLQPAIYTALFYVLAFAAAVILSTAKDIGRKNTLITVAVLMLCKAGILAGYLPLMQEYGAAAMGNFIADIARLLTALTACTFVIAKYRDKSARGSF